MKTVEDEWVLQLRPRPSETVTIEMPREAWEALRQVAERRDMSPQALIKLYVGQGLRLDLAEQIAGPELPGPPADVTHDPPRTRRKTRSK